MGGELSDPGASSQSTLVCPQCQSSMPLNAAFCPDCGHAMKRLRFADRVVAALAYLTFVPAAVLLFLPGYRRNQFVRFHAWQSVLLWGAFCLVSVASLILSNITAAMTFLMLGILASLAMLFLWVVLSLKALQGEWFGLPFFGMLAERFR